MSGSLRVHLSNREQTARPSAFAEATADRRSAKREGWSTELRTSETRSPRYTEMDTALAERNLWLRPPEMIQRSTPVTDRDGMGDRACDVLLRVVRRLGQCATVRKVRGDRRRERAAAAVCGGVADPPRTELVKRVAVEEEVDDFRRVELCVAAGDDHRLRAGFADPPGR